MKNKPMCELDEMEFVTTEYEDRTELERYYKVLGERIKKKREEMGVTQASIADHIGLTASAMANYEAGIRQIPVHILFEFARITYTPIQYFLGSPIDEPILLTEAIKCTVERFTNATYISEFIEIIGGKIYRNQRPQPLIPVPQDIAKDHDFALRVMNESTGIYDYHICKRYIPDQRFPKKKDFKYVVPQPDEWIIGKHIRGGYKLMQFKNLKPTKHIQLTEKEVEEGLNEYTIGIYAIVLARIERLVR